MSIILQCMPVWGKLPLRVLSIKAFPGESPCDNFWSLEEDVLIPLSQDSLLTGNHQAEVVKKIIVVLLPSRWVSGGHRMVAGASCPQRGAGLKASQKLHPQWWSSRSPGQSVGVSSLLWNTPCPCQTPPVPALPGVTAGGTGIWTGALSSALSPLPAEHPRLLAASTASPSAHMARCLLTSCQTISRVPEEPGLE